MDDTRTLQRLRVFLFGLSLALLLGTVAELVLERHYQSGFQLVPFVLCVGGVLAVLVLPRTRQQRVVQVLRGVLLVVMAGSLLGAAQHFLGNLDFARETQPGAALPTLLLTALTGRNPLFAPGILAVAAIIALAGSLAAASTRQPDERLSNLQDKAAVSSGTK